MTNFRLRDVKESFAQKKDWERQFPVSYYLFRPLSFLLTVAVLRWTQDPAVVAWAGFSIGLLGNAALLFAREIGLWPGIALLALCALSDAVDGNVARTTKTVSYRGKFLDGMLGAAVEGSYWFFLGVGLYRAYSAFPIIDGFFPHNNTRPLFLVLGAVITICWYFGNLVDEAFSKLQSLKEKGTAAPGLTATIQSSRFRRFLLFRVFINLHAVNLQVLVLALSAALHLVPLFLIFMSGYYILRAIVVFSFYIYRARTVLA